MTSFGERLKRIRKEHKETQEQLGNLLGKTAHTISCYENDRYFVNNRDTLALIAQHYNVSLDYLLGIVDKEPVTVSLSENERVQVRKFIEFLKVKDTLSF